MEAARNPAKTAALQPVALLDSRKVISTDDNPTQRSDDVEGSGTFLSGAV
jgi:hypothetical protein